MKCIMVDRLKLLVLIFNSYTLQKLPKSIHVYKMRHDFQKFFFFFILVTALMAMVPGGR